MKPESTLTVRLPEDLKDRIKRMAAQQGISVNQFAAYALAKEIGELSDGEAFRTFTRGIERKTLFRKIDEILANVADREVPGWDYSGQLMVL